MIDKEILDAVLPLPIVACHILAGFFAVLVLLRAVEGNDTAVAPGNGQQLIHRSAFVLVSCAPRGRC